MPQMGVSVSEGTITKWLRQPGEPIGRDEPLLEISTDKVDTEVPSPAEGVLAEILAQEGETVEVGTVIARIAPAGAEIAPAAPEPAQSPPGRRRAGAPRRRSGGRGSPCPSAGPLPPEPSERPQPTPARLRLRVAPEPSAGKRQDVRLSGRGPHRGRARRRPCDVLGHRRPGGRVTQKDILTFIESGPAAPPAAARRRRHGEPARPWPATLQHRARSGARGRAGSRARPERQLRSPALRHTGCGPAPAAPPAPAAAPASRLHRHSSR